MSAKERCKARSWADRLGYVPCANRASRDGFCGIHHPDAVKRRREKQDAYWREKEEGWKRKAEAEEAVRRKAERHDALEALTRELVAMLELVDCCYHSELPGGWEEARVPTKTAKSECWFDSRDLLVDKAKELLG